jgi:hypothetical protein
MGPPRQDGPKLDVQVRRGDREREKARVGERYLFERRLQEGQETHMGDGWREE